MNIDLSRVRKLAELVAESGVHELTVRGPELTITLKRPTEKTRKTEAALLAAGPEAIVSEVGADGETEKAEKVAACSKAVGFVHLRPHEDADPMVQVGDVVEEGQILCLVESMKVPIEVHAPCHGIVVSIEALEGHPAEYGQPLMWIKPATEKALT